MITHHTQLLNALIEKYDLKSYVEVGVQSTEQNFDKIRCNYKIGIDPALMTSDKIFGFAGEMGMTSDDAFAAMLSAESIPLYDLFFLDGLHTKEQIKKDFENSLRCLSDNGFILIHDVLPENESGTLVPRVQRQWWGDVYKWAMDIQTYDGIIFKTFNIDNGCMLVCKDSKVKSKFQPLPTTWEGYIDYGHKLMNVTNEVTI